MSVEQVRAKSAYAAAMPQRQPQPAANRTTPDASRTGPTARLQVPASASLSGEERMFFQDLFPSSSQELRDYHAYGRDGSKRTVPTGTVVDRKG